MLPVGTIPDLNTPVAVRFSQIRKEPVTITKHYHSVGSSSGSCARPILPAPEGFRRVERNNLQNKKKKTDKELSADALRKKREREDPVKRRKEQERNRIAYLKRKEKKNNNSAPERSRENLRFQRVQDEDIQRAEDVVHVQDFETTVHLRQRVVRHIANDQPKDGDQVYKYQN